jgi:hypothetical protein
MKLVIDYIKNIYDINLITPLRENNKSNTLTDYSKNKLKDRYTVENFFSILKRSYSRINIINDKKINTYNNYLNIATSLMIVNKLDESHNFNVLNELNKLNESINLNFNINLI